MGWKPDQSLWLHRIRTLGREPTESEVGMAEVIDGYQSRLKDVSAVIPNDFPNGIDFVDEEKARCFDAARKALYK